MPILEVLGFEDGPSGEQRFIQELMRLTASVKELGIVPDQVSPFIIRSGQLIPGKVIVVKVVGLFEKPERTVDVRKMLCRKIYLAVWNYLKMFQNPPVTKLVEIIIDRRINSDDGDYYGADPRAWRPDMVLTT